ncbi:hypothetical protein [Dysgonomonas reticulitermitis]
MIARNGQVIGSPAPHAAYGKFIKGNGTTYDADWRQTRKNDLWGDGTQNEVMVKAASDPCPTGWKVPSQKQWASIYTSMTSPNIWTWTADGYKVGSSLYLPAANSRYYDGRLLFVVNYGFYMSTTFIVAARTICTSAIASLARQAPASSTRSTDFY